MKNSIKRPECFQPSELRGANHPRVLRFLLAIAIRRLREARKMERERSIIFPESSVISKDVQRLSMTLERLVSARISQTKTKPQKRQVDL